MKKYTLILIPLLFIGCNFNKTYRNREEDKQEAEKITEKFYSLIKNNNRKEALKLFDLPREVGKWKDKTVTAAIGRFGPYIKCGKDNYKIPKGKNAKKAEELTLEDCQNIIKNSEPTGKRRSKK